VPWSRQKQEIARVLAEEGYLDSVTAVEEGGRRALRIALRYDGQRQPVIMGLKRVSRPSLRVYVGVADIPDVRRGLGVSILSTPRGMLADRDARKEKVGGEVICTVW
jgi:small subunit ribosomal protein S8